MKTRVGIQGIGCPFGLLYSSVPIGFKFFDGTLDLVVNMFCNVDS